MDRAHGNGRERAGGDPSRPRRDRAWGAMVIESIMGSVSGSGVQDRGSGPRSGGARGGGLGLDHGAARVLIDPDDPLPRRVHPAMSNPLLFLSAEDVTRALTMEAAIPGRSRGLCRVVPSALPMCHCALRLPLPDDGGGAFHAGPPFRRRARSASRS